jgi:aldehyde dehydrogenase (NAD+)
VFGSCVVGGVAVGGVGFDVENPATGDVFAAAPALGVEQFAAAIDAARAAADARSWAEAPLSERTSAIGAMLDWLDQRVDRLVEVVVAETGCPVTLARRAQVEAPLVNARRLLELAALLPDVEANPLPQGTLTPSGRPVESTSVYSPIGVVAAIAPYNFPFFVALLKVVPALSMGCTVVLRPNPLTPLTTLAIGEAALATGLPPGVLNVVTEPGSDGAELLTRHPGVDMVSFTGSTAVGRAVMRQGADTVKRVQLELGGKSAQVYLPGAAGAAAANTCSVFLHHAGQVCGAYTRVIVSHEEKPAVLEQIAELAAKVVVGDPTDPKVTMGPVISAAQVEKCERYVALGREAGGRVVCGGERPAGLDRGHFYAPTALDVPDMANPAARDEIFGPVVTVTGYASVGEALELANQSEYGLAAAVWGDAPEALEFASRLDAGHVCVNERFFSVCAPFGGWKQSGVGVEHGFQGLREFQSVKHLAVAG